MATLTDIQYYFMFFLVWLISTLILRSIFKKPANTTLVHLPPSPSALPVIGHLHLFNYKSLQNLSSKYGPLLYLRLGSSPYILVSSASIATEIFKTQDLTFSGRTYYGDDRILFGRSGFILAPYGDYWRFLKKLFVTELLGTRQLERSRGVRREELTRFLRKVLEKAHKNEVVDVGRELMKLTNNVTCRMVMSTRCSEEDGEADRIREMVRDAFKKTMFLSFAASLGPLKKIGLWLYGKQIMDVTRRLDELLERVLKEHEDRANRDGGDREDKDLMDLFLEVHQDDKAEFKITRNHIKAVILDVFLAGTNTSAEAMQWTMAELINHPHVFKKAREEIVSVVGTTRLVEETDIPSLPYLQAVVKEALRLHPPGPITSRECREHCKIKGFDIPESIAVLINLYAIMRDPDSWDNPNDFCPERFLVSGKENVSMDHIQNETRGQNFNFVPFGAGRRGCPGANLANILMNTTVAAMVQCVDWKIGGDGDGGGDGSKINLEVGAGVSMAMAHPLLCLPVVHFNPLAT